MNENGFSGKIKSIQGLSLSLKTYIFIIVIIATVSTALVLSGYYILFKNMEEAYNNRVRIAISEGIVFIPEEILDHFWQAIRSEEYLQVKKEAIEANDEEILIRWMRTQPGLYSEIFTEEELAEDSELAQYATLYDEYYMLNNLCLQIMDLFDVADAYIQNTVNDITYNVIDPNENLFNVGITEEPIEEFRQYSDNEYIPPTVYHSRYGWLCTSCQPIMLRNSTLGMFCVDIDMNQVIKERNRFLANSLICVFLVTTVAIVISMVMIRRSITHPLMLLAKAARDFADNNEDISKEDVIQLPIRSRDEIGTLYHEIQSMQRRIVDYTDHIMHITAEKEHIRTEMSLAARIQDAALPKNFHLSTTKVDLYALMAPAQDVSGDFYDFFLSGEDRLYLVMADVSGKGIPAALFMMRAKTAIKYNAHAGLDPAELLRNVNSVLCEENDENMFVTVWLGVLDLRSGMMRCCNAGHEYPAVMQSGDEYRLLTDEHGMALGVFENNSLVEYEIRMEPGDKLFVYTDGITEAKSNECQELFGTKRMTAYLNTVKNESQEKLLTGMLEEIRRFAGGAEQFDDITMLGITYLWT